MNIDEIVSTLEEFLSTEAEQLWLVDDEVLCDREWTSFQQIFDPIGTDLLATDVRTHAEEPGWEHWTSLKSCNDEDPLAHGVAALMPLLRLSRAAAEVILKGFQDGWTGHPEALIPTLVHRAGLSIEDIGGDGSFTPKERIGRWYDRRTWHWQGPVEHVPGMLHYPVPSSNDRWRYQESTMWVVRVRVVT
jgi:hypothetical protein